MTKDFEKYLVLIPAFNEEMHLPLLLKALKVNGFSSILVVNDGSNDNTEKVCQDSNVLCITHEVNCGLGSSLRTGFKWATGQTQFDYLITVDADGQHLIEDILKVANAVNNRDIVIGSRKFNSQNSPRHRMILNKLGDLFTFFVTGKYVKDTQSGLRGFRLNILNKLQLTSREYSISSEIIIQAIRNNFIIHNVEINAVYNQHSMNKQKRQEFKNVFYMVSDLLGKI